MPVELLRLSEISAVAFDVRWWKDDRVGGRNGEGDRTREERMRERLMETRGETMNTKG